MNGRRRARRHNDEWLPRGTTQPTKRYHGFTATLSLCDLWRDARAANDGSASPSRTVATIYRTRWHGRNPSNRTMVSPGTLKYMYDNYANPRIIGVSRRLVNGLSIESTCAFSMMVTFMMAFSCFSLYPSQHLTFCCVHLVLLIFSYCPIFSTIWYVIAALIAVLQILFFNTCGTFLSQMTRDMSRHLFHPALILFVTPARPSSACMVEPN